MPNAVLSSDTTVTVVYGGVPVSTVQVAATPASVLPAGAVAVPGPQGVPGVPGTSGGLLVFGEVPAGTQDGVNTVFTLANTPSASSTAVHRNGLRETTGSGAGASCAVSGSTLTFAVAPLPSDTVTVDYAIEGS